MTPGQREPHSLDADGSGHEVGDVGWREWLGEMF